MVSRLAFFRRILMLILLLCNNQVFLSANEVEALTILRGDIFANVTSLEEVYSEILLPLQLSLHIETKKAFRTEYGDDVLSVRRWCGIAVA